MKRNRHATPKPTAPNAADKAAREERALARINAVLKSEGCTLQARVVVTPDGRLQAQTVIKALDAE
jgi:hypothetical protein